MAENTEPKSWWGHISFRKGSLLAVGIFAINIASDYVGSVEGIPEIDLTIRAGLIGLFAAVLNWMKHNTK